MRKLFAVMACVCFVLSCNKTEENYLPVPNNNQVVHNHDYKSAYEIDALQYFVELVTSKTSDSRDKKESQLFDIDNIDLETIIEYTSDDGVKSYTFTVIEQKTQNEFFNIVIKEKNNGKLGQPYVYQYILNEDFAAQYASGSKQLEELQGFLRRYNFNSLFGNSGPFKTAVRSDPNPCDSNPTGGGGDSDAPDPPGTGSDPDGSSADGSTTECTWTTVRTCGCTPSHVGGYDGGVECFCQSRADIITVTLDCEDPWNTLGEDDCDNDGSTVPVSHPSELADPTNPDHYDYFCSSHYYEVEDSPVRLGVTAYRFGKRAYGVYKRLKKAGKLTKDNFVKGLKDAGIDELQDIADNLMDIFSGNTSGWTKVLAVIELVSGLDVNKKSSMRSKAGDWSNANTGSYRGWFSSNKGYNGKGPKGRAETSLAQQAKDNNTQIEYKKWKGADTKELNEFDRGSADRAAFKEEAIEMYMDGWRSSSTKGKLYNKIQSPGRNYIDQDGF